MHLPWSGKHFESLPPSRGAKHLAAGFDYCFLGVPCGPRFRLYLFLRCAPKKDAASIAHAVWSVAGGLWLVAGRHMNSFSHGHCGLDPQPPVELLFSFVIARE